MDASSILITAFVVMIVYQSVVVWAALRGKLSGWKKHRDSDFLTHFNTTNDKEVDRAMLDIILNQKIDTSKLPTNFRVVIAANKE